MNDPTPVIISLVALVAALMALGAFLFHHHNFQLYARFAKEWADRAADYKASMERMAPELPNPFLDVLYRMDQESMERCIARSTAWRIRIPIRLRQYYLARA